MSKTKKAPASQAPVMEEVSRKFAILFELENVAIGGRQIVFDVMKKAMTDKGVKLTPALFSRYCLAHSLSHGIGELLELAGKGRVSKDKLASDVADEVKSMVLNESLTVAPVVKKLLKRAAEKGMVVGALSSFDRDTALQLLGKLKLDGDVAAMLPYSFDDKSHSGADAWRKLARHMSMPHGACLVVATSAISAKAALTSNMKCVAIPDAFTQCQDFGGADCVADVLDEAVVDTIFTILEDR